MCMTPSPVDCSHLIVLSFCHVSFCRHQQGWKQTHTSTLACTHRDTFPNIIHKHKHFQQRPAQQCPHTLRGADTHSIPQESLHDSLVWADTHPESSTHPDTPAHQPSPLPPAHAQGFGSSSPTLVMILRLKLCSSRKCKSCTR